MVLETLKGNNAGSSIWRSRWQVGNQFDRQKRIWRVEYRRNVGLKQPLELPRDVDLTELSMVLRSFLEKIRLFSEKQQNTAVFTLRFAEAIRILDAQNERIVDDAADDYLCPDVLTVQARNLLFACVVASVFGGMGSWNDLQFDDAETTAQYELLSDEVFDLIRGTIVLATNTSC